MTNENRKRIAIHNQYQVGTNLSGRFLFPEDTNNREKNVRLC